MVNNIPKLIANNIRRLTLVELRRVIFLVLMF